MLTPSTPLAKASATQLPNSFTPVPMSVTTEKPAAEHLIHVAGEIFAARGPGATVREICSQAGCSIAAINYYFGDKQRLYFRCVQTACEQKQRLFPLPARDDPRPSDQLLRSFLHAMTARIAGQSNMTWQNTLMLREVLDPSPDIAQMLATYFQADFELLDQHLGKLLGDELDSVDMRRQLATQILSRCMFLRTGKQLRQMLSISGESNESPKLYADEICDSMLLQIEALRRRILS